MSDEDLFYTPGSIYNREREPRRDPKRDETVTRLHRDLRALYDAVESKDYERIAIAMRIAKNTLGWLEY